MCEIKPNVQCGDGGLDRYNGITGKRGQRYLCDVFDKKSSIVRELFLLKVGNALHSTWPVSVILFSFQSFALVTAENVQNNYLLNLKDYFIT